MEGKTTSLVGFRGGHLALLGSTSNVIHPVRISSIPIRRGNRNRTDLNQVTEVTEVTAMDTPARLWEARLWEARTWRPPWGAWSGGRCGARTHDLYGVNVAL